MEAVDKDGMTPLHAAAAAQFPSDLVAQVLADAGVSLARANQAGNTPAHVACQQGQNEVLAVLLEKGLTESITSMPNSKGEVMFEFDPCSTR